MRGSWSEIEARGIEKAGGGFGQDDVNLKVIRNLDLDLKKEDGSPIRDEYDR